MKFHPKNLPGVFLIEPTPFKDDRGLFRRHFCLNEISKLGVMKQISQCNLSENIHSHTLRGFHYLKEEYQEEKIISCIHGSLYDVVIDLRINSDTYLEWVALDLNDKNRLSVYIPPGCANAFLTLKENTIVHYYHSKPYVPDLENGIRFDDPALKVDWPHKPNYISKKDLNYKNYKTK